MKALKIEQNDFDEPISTVSNNSNEQNKGI